MITKQVKKSGNGAGINLPKELLGQTVHVFTQEEYEQSKEPEKNLADEETGEKTPGENLGAGGQDEASVDVTDEERYSEGEYVVLTKLQQTKTEEEFKSMVKGLLSELDFSAHPECLVHTAEDVSTIRTMIRKERGYK